MSLIAQQQESSGVGAAFTSVLSSLQNQRRRLEVISTNIANLNTVGFKASRITFLESLGQTIGKLYTPFEQGSFTATNNPTDLAIDGNSFFVVANGEQQEYTRAGAFFFDASGKLVTQDTRAVQGWLMEDVINTESSSTDQTTNTALGIFQDIVLDPDSTVGALETNNIWVSGNLNSSLVSIAQIMEASDSFRINNAGTIETADATAELNDLVQVTTDFVVGDTIDVTGTLRDGTAVTGSFTYGAANDGTTIQDLLDRINSVFSSGTNSSEFASVTFVAGKIVLTDDVEGDSQTTLDLEGGATNTGVMTLPNFGATTDGYTPKATTSIVVFDSFGTEHHLTVTFTKTGNNREWAWEVEIGDNETINAGVSGTITFDTSGQFITNTYDDANGTLDIDPGNGSNTLSIALHFNGNDGLSPLTQYDQVTTVSAKEQDGQASGTLDGIRVDEEGYIIGSFTNGVVMRLAQLAMAEFSDPTSLAKTGASNFLETNFSGQANIQRAADFGTGIRSGNLEVSNVDMADQFIQMIDAQKGYQAAGRIVSVLDRIMEETTRFGR